MFMRRGCLFGCGGWLIACAVVGLLVWFVAIPRLGDAISDGLSDGLSTIIADEVSPLYSRADLQQGQDVRFSLSNLNSEFQSGEQDVTFDGIRFTSSGNELVIEAEVEGRTFDISFMPTVTSDGRFELQPVDDGGWWQRQFMGILSGGFEKSINGWLDRNDLRLRDVYLEDGDLVFSVIGN